MTAESSSKVADFWNDRHKDPVKDAHDNFLVHPFVQSYMSLRAFGSIVSQMATLQYEIERRTKPGDRILSVGVGRAAKERYFAKHIPDRQFVGIDIADSILEEAREINRQEGVDNLELELGNFNELDLDANAYDIVLGLGAIHHVEALEQFWDNVAKSLRPGGVVVAQEYIGANRFQFTDAQIEHGTRCLEEFVPDEHKTNHRRCSRPKLEDMIAVDPSEAVRSAEILSTCEAAGWTVDGFCSGGGGLLQPVLMFQIATYDHRNWQHNLVLSKLFAEEDRLMQEGIITDDFAMFIGIPPS